MAAIDDLPQGWTRVQSEDISPSGPALFLACSIESGGYRVVLTDLSNVWVEQLNRGDIMKRARAIKTIIDPNESASQHRLFLRTVKDALDGQTPTTFRLAAKPSSQEVIVQATCRLPPPLDQLTWHIHFKRAVEEGVKNAIVLPLLRVAVLEQRKRSALQSEIRSKDHIIMKLLDAIESIGGDLSSIFPGLSGAGITRVGEHRNWLMENVHGMKPFNAETMFRNMIPSQLAHLSNEKLMHEVAASPDWSLLSENTDEPTMAWWSELPSRLPGTEKEEKVPERTGASKKSAGRFAIKGRTTRRRTFNDDVSSTSAGDNATVSGNQSDRSRPPAGSGRPQTERIHSPESTSDTSEQVQKRSASPRPARKPQARRKLGKIGGARVEAKDPSDADEEDARRSPEPRKTSTDEQTPPAAPLADSEPGVRKPLVFSPKRPRVGVIGRRQPKAPVIDAGEEDAMQGVKMGSAVESEADDKQQRDEGGPKGRDADRTTAHESRERDVNSREEAQKSSPTPAVNEEMDPEEAAKQLADQRRQELKRQLATQPVSKPKKRRF